MSLALALVPTRAQTDAGRREEERKGEEAEALTIMMMMMVVVMMVVVMLRVHLVSLLSASIVRSSARLHSRDEWIHGTRSTRQSGGRTQWGLRPRCVRGNDAPYGAQGPERGKEEALTLELQDREGMRMAKGKRRGKQASSENSVVLYEGAGRSLERRLHSSAYEGLLHLGRHWPLLTHSTRNRAVTLV